jgi:hypothetical protein
MMLKLKSTVCIIFLSILFLGCQHELNFEGNQVSGTAVFSFYGSPGACGHAIVTGSYKTGTAMGNTNVVTIGVTVAAAGTYTVSTATVNGIKFMGSGTFTVAGPQTMALTGSGMPVVEGTFSYTLGSNTCSFPVTISNGINTGSAVFTFNGAPGPCTNVSVGGNYTAGNLLTASNIIKIDVNVLKTGTYSIKTDLLNGILFSGSGSLTTMGYDVVSLNGTGTPTIEGVFRYIPSNNGCPFAIRVFP